MKYSKVSIYVDAKKFIRDVTSHSREDYFTFLFCVKATGRSVAITFDEAGRTTCEFFMSEENAKATLDIKGTLLYQQGFTLEADSREINHYPEGSAIDDILGVTLPLLGQEKYMQLMEHLQLNGALPTPRSKPKTAVPYDVNVEMRKKYPDWGTW